MHRRISLLLTLSLAYSQVVCNDECSHVLGDTNNERAKVGLPPLCLNSLLMEAAQEQANYQESINTMTHTGAGGTTVGDRVTSFGYKWSTVAENAAEGQDTSRSVMLSWMNSPDHRANILSTNTQMGIAHVGNFWTQTFGNPRPGYGGCNVEPLGGALGEVDPVLPDIGPMCTGVCQSLVQVINTERQSKGYTPVCVNAKLMAAAATAAASSNGMNDYRVMIENTGFGAKGVGIETETIRSSAGEPTDSQVVSMWQRDYHGAGGNLDSTFTRVGIAWDTSRTHWYALFAATYTPDQDPCQGMGSVSQAVTPQGSCAFILSPCACIGTCGWSQGQCVSGVSTGCSDCPALSQCATHSSHVTVSVPPRSLVQTASKCSKQTTPCKCTGSCGWSTSRGSCLAASSTVFTDCFECSSQAHCATRQTQGQFGS